MKDLAQLLIVNKEWAAVVSGRVECAALRLAQFDLIREYRAASSSRRRFVVHSFDVIMEVFSTTWSLRKPMPDRLRLLPLHELCTFELSLLRDILVRGWQVRASVLVGVDWRALDLVWVAPLERKF